MNHDIASNDRRRAMSSTWEEKIGITALKGVSVLYEDDIYDLACLLLKMNEAKDRGTNHRSRHTVHGLATAYSMIANMSRDAVLNIFEAHDLPLRAVVEYDDSAA